MSLITEVTNDGRICMFGWWNTFVSLPNHISVVLMDEFCNEQNVRTVAKYYTRITIIRLSELLDLSTRETEETLARLAVAKMVFAKIDRPAGVVSFVEPKSTDRVLNEWSSDVNKLMVR